MQAKKSSTPPQNLSQRKTPRPGILGHPLLELNDQPTVLREITEAEIVSVLTAFEVLQIARADFEQKRAALALKLLFTCKCEKGQHTVALDEQNRLVFEEFHSEDTLTGRPIIERTIIPSVG